MIRQLDRQRPHLRSNEVRLWLSVLVYNLGNLWRRLFGSMVRRIEALAVASG